MIPPPIPAAHEAHFHDAECGGYGGDLELWERLASERGDPLVDLGCGTGRVALHLAARGHRVIAVDRDPTLTTVLAERAVDQGLKHGIEVAVADARALDLDPLRPPLVIAPMQLVQLLDAEGRRRMLRRVVATLAPRGMLCAVLLEEGHELGSGRTQPRPDVREVDGWIHSSLPLEVRTGPDAIEVVRLRQLVGPDGSLSETRHTVRLARLAPAALEREAAAAGLRPLGRERIAPTAEHVGSIAVMLEVADG